MIQTKPRTFHSKRILSALAAAGLVSAGLGCKSTNELNTMPAAQAWEEMRNNETKDQFGSALTSQVLGRDISGFRESKVKEADAAAESAMASDLPKMAIDQMVDDVARFFVVELPKISEVEKSDTQYILGFGDFVSFPPGPSVQVAKQELVGKLFQNKAVTNAYFVMTTDEADADKALAKIAGKDLSGFRDPLQRDIDPTKAKTYDPKFVYFIQGKLISTNDKVNHSITLTMQMDLIKPLTRQNVKTQTFKRTYMWHPTRGVWELQPNA
ncbi:MAG: hypothetical protein QM754_01840 [Tepidisphaeraceae bacterium]